MTILDLVFLAREESGDLLVVDLEEEIDAYGLGQLRVERVALISDEDLDVVRDALEPDSSAVVIVFEHTWTTRVAAAVGQAGGEVGLHVRIPVADVDAALAAASDVAAATPVQSQLGRRARPGGRGLRDFRSSRTKPRRIPTSAEMTAAATNDAAITINQVSNPKVTPITPYRWESTPRMCGM